MYFHTAPDMKEENEDNWHRPLAAYLMLNKKIITKVI